MKRLPKRVYAALLVSLGPMLFSIIGLQHYQRTWRLLNRIDAVIESEPAEALRLLDSLDRRRLYDASQRAKFALLYTQAQDKNYIDETDDSLIRYAVDYYERLPRPDLRDRFRSLYYLGRVQYRRGELSRAMVSYMEAEQLKEAIDDDLSLGLLYGQMGNIYKLYYDYQKALDAYKCAYDYYRKIQQTSYLNFTLLKMGLMYCHMQRYTECEKILFSVLEQAKSLKDTTLMEYCYGNLVIQYNEQERFDEAFQIYNRLITIAGENYVPSPTYAISIANMWSAISNNDKAKYYLSEASRRVMNKTDSIYLQYYLAKILRRSKDYSDAYNYLGDSYRLQDSVLRSVLQQPILSTQRDFLANKLEYQAYKARVERKMRYYGLVIASLVMLFLFGFLLYRLKRQDAMISEGMMMVQNLEETLRRNEESAREKIDRLFKNLFTTINRLGKAYCEQETDADQRKWVLVELKKTIKECRSPKVLQELEEIVNDCKSGAMRLLREEFPHLKEQEYHELCYYFAGFVIPLVGVMIDKSPATVYQRRLRFRAKFRESNAPHRELFVDLLA